MALKTILKVISFLVLVDSSQSTDMKRKIPEMPQVNYKLPPVLLSKESGQDQQGSPFHMNEKQSQQTPQDVGIKDQFQVPQYLPSGQSQRVPQDPRLPVMNIPLGGNGLPQLPDSQYKIPQYISTRTSQQAQDIPPPPAMRVPYGNDILTPPVEDQFKIPQYLPLTRSQRIQQDEGQLPLMKVPYSDDALVPHSNNQYREPDYIPQGPQKEQNLVPYGNDALTPPQYLPQGPRQHGEQQIHQRPSAMNVPPINNGLAQSSDSQYRIPQHLSTGTSQQERPSVWKVPGTYVPYGDDALLPPSQKNTPPEQNDQEQNDQQQILDQSPVGESFDSPSDSPSSSGLDSQSISDYQSPQYAESMSYYSLLNKLGAGVGDDSASDSGDGSELSLGSWVDASESYEDGGDWDGRDDSFADQLEDGEEEEFEGPFNPDSSKPRTRLQPMGKGLKDVNIVGGESLMVYCIPMLLLFVLVFLVWNNKYFSRAPKIVTVDPESIVQDYSIIDAKAKEIEPLLREEMSYKDEIN